MRIRLLLLTVLGCALAAGSGAPAHAGVVRHVALEDDYFYPSSVAVPQGGTVSWDATGDRTHTATDGSGMDLFDSGLVEPGDPSYSVTFTAAATYPVVCTLHVEMVGRIRVPMRTSPRDGTTSGPFGVIWASERPAEGSVVDVQVRRPGRSWTTWRSGVETTHDRFHPTSDGTYRFRSRLRATLPDASAGWSDVISVRVRG